MRLYTFQLENRQEQVGVEAKPGRIYPISAFGLPYQNMNALLQGVSQAELDLLRMTPNQPGFPLAEVKLCAPIPAPNQDVICLGMNYTAHKAEAEQFDPNAFTRNRGSAVYFSKRVTWAPGYGDRIPSYPGLVESLDYETELGVILGRDAKNVKPEDAYHYVFGYTIINDISARNLQTGHKQWYFGKSLDGFTPMGPCIVTKDEMGTPPIKKIRTWINGELRQDALTDQLIFDIPYIISELSKGMTLRAGTIIATGTPAGVGMGFDPPKFLSHGDMIRSEIEGIGILENQVD